MFRACCVGTRPEGHKPGRARLAGLTLLRKRSFELTAVAVNPMRVFCLVFDRRNVHWTLLLCRSHAVTETLSWVEGFTLNPMRFRNLHKTLVSGRGVLPHSSGKSRRRPQPGPSAAVYRS